MPPVMLKRGGPHNRRDRTSLQLGKPQCLQVIGRSYDAWDAGLPLSRFITLAWGVAGIDPERAVWATGQFIDKAREWMRHHGYPVMPWVWVQETGDTFGQHAHILLYVPPKLFELFRPMPTRWARAIAGRGRVGDLVDTKHLPGAKSASINPGAYEAQLLGRLAYMLKNAPEEWAEPLGLAPYISKPWGQRSKVYGRRASCWQTRRGKGAV